MLPSIEQYVQCTTETECTVQYIYHTKMCTHANTQAYMHTHIDTHIDTRIHCNLKHELDFSCNSNVVCTDNCLLVAYILAPQMCMVGQSVSSGLPIGPLIMYRLPASVFNA